jgi:hypothetical protein
MRKSVRFLLPSGEKVGGKAARMRGLVQRTLTSDIVSASGGPLIRLAARATFSPEGRRT